MSRSYLKRLRQFYADLQTPRLLRAADGLGLPRQIVTIRHARPDLKRQQRYSRREAGQYFRDYDRVPVVDIERQVFELEEGQVSRIYASNLPRSYYTAEALFGKEFPIERSDIFRELERQIPKLPGRGRFPMPFWQVYNRALYFSGRRYRDIESFPQARRRVKEGAEWLDRVAAGEGAAILVAHGFYNYFLGRALRRLGYRAVRKPGRGYLGVGVYARLGVGDVK